MVIMTVFAFVTGWMHVNRPIITMNNKFRNVALQQFSDSKWRSLQIVDETGELVKK